MRNLKFITRTQNEIKSNPKRNKDEQNFFFRLIFRIIIR